MDIYDHAHFRCLSFFLSFLPDKLAELLPWSTEVRIVKLLNSARDDHDEDDGE